MRFEVGAGVHQDEHIFRRGNQRRQSGPVDAFEGAQFQVLLQLKPGA